MSDTARQRSPAWILAQVPAVLLCVSILVVAWFIVGSFVTYAPTVDANTIQNIYISRIVHYGLAIAVLNGLAILSLGAIDRSSQNSRGNSEESSRG
jgi:hypothetical protein